MIVNIHVKSFVAQQGYSIVFRCNLKQQDYWTFNGLELPPNSRLLNHSQLVYIEEVDFHNAGECKCLRSKITIKRVNVEIMGEN